MEKNKYNCIQCGFKGKDNYSLQRHLKSIKHKKEFDENEDLCLECNYRYRNRGNYLRHLETDKHRRNFLRKFNNH
jgi:C4-type Zn-finger protein